jgi:hypothetical protein
MTILTNLGNDIPWLTTVLALSGGVGVALFSQFIKKLAKLENEKVIQFVVGALAFLAAALQYLLSSHSIPPTVLGLHTAVIIGIAQPTYLYFVKPANKFFSEVKKFTAEQQAKTQGAATTAPSTPEPTANF